MKYETMFYFKNNIKIKSFWNNMVLGIDMNDMVTGVDSLNKRCFSLFMRVGYLYNILCVIRYACDDKRGFYYYILFNHNNNGFCIKKFFMTLAPVSFHF